MRAVTMMLEALFTPLCLAVSATGLALIRHRPRAERLAFDILMLCAVTPVLAERNAFPLPPSMPAHGAQDWWTRALAILWWVLAARAAVAITAHGPGRGGASRQSQLLSDLLAGGVWLIAVLIILNSILGLPIGGLLATSGIVAVVIGLAMQNTLGDVFSGIAVGLDQPFHPGDRIAIGTMMEGVVIRANWRSIRVQTDSEDIVTIPNSVLAHAPIVNRTMASERLPVTVEIVLRPDARPDDVLELLRHAVMLCPDILASPAASVGLSRLGLRSNTYHISGYAASAHRAAAARGHLLREARRVLHHGGINDGSHRVKPDQLLHDMPLFGALAPQHIADLCHDLQPLALDPGECLFQQGDEGDRLFVIGAGVLDIGVADDDRGTGHLGRLGAGDHIGEISLLTGDPRAATVTALTQVTAFALRRDAIDRLLAAHPDLVPDLERAVKRSLALVHAAEKDHAEAELETASLLLKRIRGFFERHRFPARHAQPEKPG